MRTISTCLLILLLAAGGYAYTKRPELFAKVSHDLFALIQPATGKDAEPPAPAAPVTSPALVPTAAAAPAPPPTPAVKAWTPPELTPAQPNWTWQTLDGNTYENVVITKIGPRMVSILHSKGVAHLDISTLPPDLRKQLNYDPAAAVAANAEVNREAEHPYYRLDQLADAQAAARQTNRPLAWICSLESALSDSDAPPNSGEELTQMVVAYLKTRAVTVFLEGSDGFSKCPAILRDQGFFHFDDGPIPGGHHFYMPKVVFSNADVTQVYGRAWNSEMKVSREAGLQSVLDSIH